MAGLDEYVRRRDFDQTREPSADADPEVLADWPRPLFVVQKHAASRLHYDLRLECDGVLLSWAVPKGPTLTPGVKRLAVPTEDHPLAYATFEGVIPDGAYGAGKMIVWDRGRFEPDGDVRARLAAGKLDFVLRGERLRGRFHLVRTASAWLWVKGKDAFARAHFEPESIPSSVLTGRSLEELVAP
jgi:bifunctional non-homologous end joining protein LigD